MTVLGSSGNSSGNLVATASAGGITDSAVLDLRNLQFHRQADAGIDLGTCNLTEQ